jgi:DNA-binding XRE family transcriptional regulator
MGMEARDLKEYRKKHSPRLTQQELADELEVSLHTVQSWEQGKNPIPKWVEKIITSQRDIGIPLDLMMQISQAAQEDGVSFEHAFFSILKDGLTRRPKSKTPPKQ